MNVVEVAYSADERQIACAAEDGSIEVREVNPEDGSPAALVSRLFVHKHRVVGLAFVNDGELLSVDEHGTVALSDPISGEASQVWRLGGEYVEVSLSPSRRMLFGWSYESAIDTNTFALDLVGRKLIYGPELERVGIHPAVFALDDRTAAYQHTVETELPEEEWEGGTRVDEALTYVDFESGARETKRFDGGPANTVSDRRLMVIDGRLGLGLRCAFAERPALGEFDGKTTVAVPVELFDPRTLERKGLVVPMLRLVEDEEQRALWADGSRQEEAFRDQLDDLFEKLEAAVFTADGRSIWFTLEGGAVRRVDLPEGTRQGFLLNPDGDHYGHSFLQLSPRGTYLAFGPAARYVAVARHQVPPGERVVVAAPTVAEGSGQPPRFFRLIGAGRWAVAVSGAGAAQLIDWPARRRRYWLGVEYGSDATGAEISADGGLLHLTYAGRDSLRIAASGDTIDSVTELPFPPHVVFVTLLPDGRWAFAHHSGAVMVMDGDTVQAFRHDEPHEHEEDEDEEEAEAESEDEESEDEESEEEESEEEESDEEDREEEESEGEKSEEEAGPPPELPWRLVNPEGVAPLELVGNVEGVFVYNDYFEQKDEVRAVVTMGEQRELVLTIADTGRLEAYRFDPDRIRLAFVQQLEMFTRLSAGRRVLAALNPERGDVSVMRLEGDELIELFAFKDPGVKLVAVSDDDERLWVFNDETGCLSCITVASREETQTARYVGPSLHGVHFEPEAGRVLLTEPSGAVLVVEPETGRLEVTCAVSGGDEEPGLTFDVAPVGRLFAEPRALNRCYTSQGARRAQQESEERKRDVFIAGPTGRDEKALEKQLARAIEKLDALRDQGAPGQIVALLSPLLDPLAEQDYFSLRGGHHFKRNLGAGFAERGEAYTDLGEFGAAEHDFRKATDFHYFGGYPSLMRNLCFKQQRYADTLALAEEVLTSRAAKDGIGLRKSTPFYTAMLHALIQLGRRDEAAELVELILVQLAPFVGVKEDAEDADGDAEEAPLERLLGDLEEQSREPGEPAALAAELLARMRQVLGAYPTNPAPDPARRDLLGQTVAQARFLHRNGRVDEALRVCDQALAPHEDVAYFGLAYNSREKRRLGELWALRGRARAAAAEYDAAIGDFEKAIEFREVGCYAEAVSLCLRRNALERATRLLRHFRRSPFNWGSEYWNPFTGAQFGYLLALELVLERRRGVHREADVLVRAHAADASEIAARLRRELVEVGGPQRFAAETVAVMIEPGRS